VESDYVPWFNGRPYLTNKARTEAFFEEVTSGRTRYDIKVVVAIGDHDAMRLYEQIAAMKRIVKFVWLHNIRSGRGGPVVAEPDKNGLEWASDAIDKTTLVYGCVNQEAILRGLELALS
jgi:hypothetical protein